MISRSKARRLLDSGQSAAARTAYEALVAHDPGDGESWFLLGAACGQLGDLAAAVECGKRAVALLPSRADARYNLGQAYRGLGRAGEAIACYRRTLELDPAFRKAYVNLGSLLLTSGELEQAAKCFDALLQRSPDDVDARCGLGSVELARKRFNDAATHFAAALRARPGHFEAAKGLVNALLDLERFPEAESLARKAIQAWPGQAFIWAALGKSLQGQLKLQAAVEAYQRALEFEPRSFLAHHNLAAVCYDLGDIAQAIEHWRSASEINPGQPVTFSNLLMALNYEPTVEPQALASEHRAWAQRYTEGISCTRGHVNSRDPDRILRIGYVSADFRDHAVAQFMVPLLEHHDRNRFRVYCYSNVQRPDQVTERIRALSDDWREIVHATDTAAAALVASDGIDILVDLSGHSGGHRLLVFARRPAPVQVTYLGYPNTTGLAEMDFRITDAWADPPGVTEMLHAEELVRIPGGFLGYEGSDAANPASVPPFFRKGYIAFGSYNNIAKITPEVISVWSGILRAVPDSILRIKSRSFADELAVAKLRERFCTCGVQGARIEVLGYLPSKHDHLESYGDIDIALDPFPYNGTTTTCEAMWMGVPVLTLAGETHASRVGVSLLSAVGMVDWIASDARAYVDLGARYARDPDRLAHLRENLRARMAASTLCDVHGFTRRLEGAYREVWRRWCEAPPTGPRRDAGPTE